MPKAKPDKVIVHRIEFQESERELLSMIAGSFAANNVTKSAANLVTPFTSATVAGVAWSLAILGTAGLTLSEKLRAKAIEEGQDLKEFLVTPFWKTLELFSGGEVKSQFEKILENISQL